MAYPKFTVAELVAATNGVCSGEFPKTISGVYTDSREAGDGRMFLALSGEKFDGHNFLSQALKSGAAAVCTEHDWGNTDGAIPELRVKNTTEAYQNIAAFHRNRQQNLRVAAITGSVGKTSVKEELRAIFNASVGADAVVATEGNTNNQIGVPKNLLRLTEATRFAAIEAGTNHHGEIAPLARAITPDVAIVNSIAPCHLEFLGSLDGVAREKGTIFSGLKRGGSAVIPYNTPQKGILTEAAKQVDGVKILYFGFEFAADVRCEKDETSPDGKRFYLNFPNGERCEVNWSLGGDHQILNAAAAGAAAYALGISPQIIARGLADTVLPGMRMKKTVVNGALYINDAYNANPASMRATLTQLRGEKCEGKIYLALGAMRELGEFSQAEHRELVKFAQKLFPEATILPVGQEFADAGVNGVFPTATVAGAYLAEHVIAGDLVFAKGSRGIGMENALPPEAR